jgi:hypothetical protein
VAIRGVLKVKLDGNFEFGSIGFLVHVTSNRERGFIITSASCLVNIRDIYD